MDLNSFGYIISALSLICGLLLVTGHGSFLLQSGRNDDLNRIYYEEKVERASGIAFLLVGAASVIDCFTTAMPLKIGYVVFLVAVFAILIWYINKKCRR